MRIFLIMLPLLAGPATALAETSTNSLSIGVTVLAACPTGSGKPCGNLAAPEAPEPVVRSPATHAEPPILVLRDESARTVSVIY